MQGLAGHLFPARPRSTPWWRARHLPVLILLDDGLARPRSAIIAALADRHPKEDVIRTLMRLAVTGQLVETGRKYSLAPAPEAKGEGA
jgi:hypothetical protein